MREIMIGEKQIRVRATPLALLFYKQEFKTDLIGDLVKMKGVKEDPGQLDSVSLLQITWAMNKADNPKDFTSFETWLNNLENIDFADTDMLLGVLNEATDGFFRGGGKQ